MDIHIGTDCLVFLPLYRPFSLLLSFIVVRFVFPTFYSPFLETVVVDSMLLLSSFVLSCLSTAVVAAGLSDSSLESHVDALALDFSFNPVKASYWTGLPHHRRTPFAVSPDGKSAYLAYLDASETDVHIQQLDPTTFAAVGAATTVSGAKEAGGLVAHDDGFALLTNEALPSGTSNAPAGSTPVPVLYRYTSGKQTWKTFLGGPGVHADFGLAASPDLNGDLAYSEAAGLYGAYFVITAYTGDASGHFGDSVQYVKNDGTLTTISGASSSWGCSHNTGIAFEAADQAPFASLCAEDQGAIWLNTKTQTMNGVKVSNENTTNGASGEPMGGMSGSYSGLARFVGKDSYIFTWVSRGAKDLTENAWLGAGFTNAQNRTNGRNVAIALFSDKNTLVGQQASSAVGAVDGDSQVNWITTGTTADCSNAHVAAFDGDSALVTWEQIDAPSCDFVAMGCSGAFSGAYYQLVTNGQKVGQPVKKTDTYVAGDMVTMADGRICWPYVSMTWDLSKAVGAGLAATTSKKMSFACASLGDSSSGAASSSAVAPQTTASPASSSSSPIASSQAAPALTSVVVENVSAPVAVAPSPYSSAAAVASSSETPVATQVPAISSSSTSKQTPVVSELQTSSFSFSLLSSTSSPIQTTVTPPSPSSIISSSSSSDEPTTHITTLITRTRIQTQSQHSHHHHSSTSSASPVATTPTVTAAAASSSTPSAGANTESNLTWEQVMQIWNTIIAALQNMRERAQGQGQGQGQRRHRHG